MKKLLWLGSFMDETTNQKMIAQGYTNAASFVSQNNLLEGIEAATNLVFDSVNAVAMAGYPHQGGITLESYQFSHAEGAKDVLVGYLNPLYLNKLFMKKAMLRGVKVWLKERYEEGDALDVFIYEMRSACLDAAVYIKKKVPSARIHLIIPDLPCFMDLNMSKLKRILKRIDWNQMVHRFVYIDDFLPYAETMVDYLGIREKSWIVMEGSLNKKDIQAITTEIDNAKGCEPDKKIIMYSGWVDRSFGIDVLVDAMKFLDESYELWITGGGPYDDELKKKVKGNIKVKYYGFLPTRKELFKLQARASVMMNIRDPKIEAAHYCFPSKLFEYMLLGRPVLSVKLRGIPDEYWKFLFEVDELKAEKIAEGIVSVMTDENRDTKAQAGRKFIEDQKNNFAMAKKIIEFVEG